MRGYGSLRVCLSASVSISARVRLSVRVSEGEGDTKLKQGLNRTD